MRLPISPEQQQEIDNMLFRQYADGGLGIDTVRRYREFTGASINEMVEALVGRKSYLREIDSSRFKSEPDWRLCAITELRELMKKEKIVVIEGEWDADSFSWYVRISAITDVPSAQHPRYTAHLLPGTRGTPDQAAEKALLLGNELAALAGVDFVLNPYDEDWDRRWWHRHG